MAQRPIHATQTVGDVAHRYPGTPEIMKQMGVNHCGGAHQPQIA